jgi:hypothetical protein
LGIKNTIDYLEQLKIPTEEMQQDLSLALGSGNLTPMEVACGFAVIANGGYDVQPYLIDTIRNDKNQVVFQAPKVVLCEQDCGPERTPSGEQDPMENIAKPDQVKNYLTLTGWESYGSENGSWDVYVNNVDGEDLEIVFPRYGSKSENISYVKSSLEVISASNEEEMEKTLLRIRTQNQDLLLSRIPNSGEGDKLSILDASKMVNHFKSLVAYSAASEDEPQTYFHGWKGPAREMANRYKFGHTFKGSFGFSIESPSLRSKNRLQQELDTYEPSSTIIPIERRVLERVIRGLYDVVVAKQNNNAARIVDDYHSGLNANMCSALGKIVKNFSVEYDVLWSPRIEASEDVKNLDPITITPSHNTYLKEAEEALREHEPVKREVIGYVIGMSAEEPMSMGAKRIVEIDWRFQDDVDGPSRVLAELPKEEYRKGI